MDGALRLNSIGRWEIVDDLGNRLELSSGDVVELLNYTGGSWAWVQTRIESRGTSQPPYFAEYYAVDGSALYTGKRARYEARSRFLP